MAGEWSTATIAECAANEPYATQIGPFGNKIRAEMYTSAGAPILRGTNVNTEERFHDDDFVFIDSEVAEREFSKFICEADDVILCHKGTLGKIGIIPKHSRFKRYIMGNSMMKVRCDRRKLDSSFLYYWLTSKDGQDYLFSRVSQVGVPQIQRPLTTLREAMIPLPPLPEQRAIANILGTLDDKIELNRRMSETLEAMARALFKSWFVDFDPVRARMEGRDPGLPKHIANLFPDRLVHSELGEIPEGWDVEAFANTVDVIGGGTPKTSVPEYWNGDIPWFSVVDAPTGPEVWVIDTEKKVTKAGVKNSSTRILPVGTTIISARGTVGRIALVGVPMAMNQSCYGLRGACGSSGFFTYFSTRELVARLQQHAHGSVFDTITRETLNRVYVLMPTEMLIETFEKSVSPHLERIRTTLMASRTLATLRDALLPKLISGEMRVEEADRVMERVAS